MSKKIIQYAVIAFIIILLALAGFWYYWHKKIYPSTDDAYVQAHVVHIAPQISGDVQAIYVRDQQHVKQGQKLFSINPRPFQIAVNAAQAKLQSARQQMRAEQAAVTAAQAVVIQREAELHSQRQTTHRILTLVKRKFLSSQKGTLASAKLAVAIAALKAAHSELNEAQQRLGTSGMKNAQIRAATARLASAKLDLSYTHINAPTNGYIVKFDVRKGEKVSAYQPLFAIIDNQLWWVTANYRETDLARIRPGQPVNITLDMYPDIKFSGVVHSLGSGSGAAFALLPPENATGNWVKVTQRFPIRIYFKHLKVNYPLRMGASANVTVDTSGFKRG